jgi:5-methylcytosine-specific restriction endonuclease McrA
MASARQRLKDFFLQNLGQVVTAGQLQQVANISEWARRVRELRDEEGWPILTNNDLANLKPGEYLLEKLPEVSNDRKFERTLNQKLRSEVLDRDGFTCQMCGVAAGDLDTITGRTVRLHIGHIVDKSLGGDDTSNNLRTLCSSCNQGAKNLTHEKPSTIWLLSQVRRAGVEEQLAIFDWLTKKFGTLSPSISRAEAKPNPISDQSNSAGISVD